MTTTPETPDTSPDSWWAEVTAAALLGTGRRPPPATPTAVAELAGPSRAATSAEIRLLDAAALGSVLVRAGRPPVVEAPEPDGAAPPETAAPAPARAVQLLELALHQSPVGQTLQRPLLLHWLSVAAGTERRVPERLLPGLLDLATRDSSLRDALRTAGGARAAWLAAANPQWSWLRPPVRTPVTASVDPAAWALLPTGDRAAVVRRLRVVDSATARALVESTWTSDAAAARGELLAALRTGLGDSDAELLERALDDRSGPVRAAARTLLDALPASPRGRRLAARLRPLLSVSGLVRRSLSVELPVAPDADGVRDGLDAAPRGRSERGYWLEQLAAGAPLEVWTGVTGRDPGATWRMIGDADARAGIVRAVLARRDRAWASAIARSGDGVQLGLLGLLPPDERDAVAHDQILRAGTPAEVHRLIREVPGPWGAGFSRAVVERLATKDQPGLRHLLPELAHGLDPAALPSVRSFADRTGDDDARRLVQFLTLVPAITEAFR